MTRFYYNCKVIRCRFLFALLTQCIKAQIVLLCPQLVHTVFEQCLYAKHVDYGIRGGPMPSRSRLIPIKISAKQVRTNLDAAPTFPSSMDRFDSILCLSQH